MTGDDTNRCVDAGNASHHWETTILALTAPAARADLRTAWARRLVKTDPNEAMRHLRLAAAEADMLINQNGPPDRPVILVTRARQAVRALASTLSPAPENLPVWAVAPLPTDHLDLVNGYGRGRDWPSKQQALDEHRATLVSAEFHTTLAALVGLNPANTLPARTSEDHRHMSA